MRPIPYKGGCRMYFKEEINGWDSWGKVFNSLEAFRELVQAIFEKEGIQLREEIENLTPGTNAVFKAGNIVIKIFAPDESELGTETDYQTELTVMKHLGEKGVAAPGVIACGEIKDRYLFRYILMEYAMGEEAGRVLPCYTTEQKKEIVKQLKRVLNILNQPAEELLPKRDLKKQAAGNFRLKGLSQTLIQELEDCVQKQEVGNCCLVHGDITGENVLIDSEGTLRLIDFADCNLAPAYYELAPIVFELFKGDKEYVSEFVGEKTREEFFEQLMKGLALHDFCGNLIKDYLTRQQIPYESVMNLEELRSIIRSNIF